MKLKLSIFAIFLFSACNLFAQNASTNPFDKFANNQSGLIQKAYDRRDDAEALKLMTELMTKYNQLNADDKRTSKGYLTNNWYNVSCLYSLINKEPEALSMLDSAVHYGYINYSHLLEDSDFAKIKNEQKFKQIAGGMRSVGDYNHRALLHQ
ncbi:MULTISPECIES: hypothetical protein [unclassified Mucilaginibacter]|uniref:TPR end-of-group domain-containing protein n=1 Tax=unclassified Mucilaginibacter TaxID=2617802 RepID=UPI002AC8A1D5|nr:MULTISPECIES: hypothetical protein [unclassified Mucilaginibacter]MEB0261874.1 hypothetical protein [Mucilaginibacter sp. 10I4]MEB0278904.1 hypothetical protein [Mucilaginibacter sp. 10B2]MEB0299730.1 hypothetical protein [Mucilaginibacter sp. 5C4]WPX22086.1 hypothetical protein RHM67_12425 [Mucilaginibacter sp. 5C4]